MQTESKERSLIFVSGYYGFDNLGDEAILEELIHELKRLVKPEEIVVLSANPELTEKRYGVRALPRKNFMRLFSELTQARLFISGGGGLFQNTRSLGSIIFYGVQILMARANQARILVYAQGLGPLQGIPAQSLCRQFLNQADAISVRDDASLAYLKSWNLNGTRTADPVFSLAESTLPEEILRQLQEAGAAQKNSRCVGLSLRPSQTLSQEHFRQLAGGLSESLEPGDELLLLPLQPEQDLPVLKAFREIWQEKGLSCRLLDTSALELPSQWVGVFARLKLLVGMRLHALIMALKSGRPVAGIAYDPKVSQLLSEFGQLSLILNKESAGKDWPEILKTVMNNREKYALQAGKQADRVLKLAGQNFEGLKKILDIQD